MHLSAANIADNAPSPYGPTALLYLRNETHDSFALGAGQGAKRSAREILRSTLRFHLPLLLPDMCRGTRVLYIQYQSACRAARPKEVF